MIRCAPLALLMLLLSGMGRPCRAGAWTVPKGKGQIIFNYYFYDTTHVFDENGNRLPIGKHGRFTKHELNPYIEYGFTNRLSLIGNFSFPSLTHRDDDVRLHSMGMGDGEVGLKYRLTRTESGLVCATQATVKFFGYPKDRVPSPGNSQTDYEGRLMLGKSFHLSRTRYGYWGLETAYRYRSGFPADQLRGDFTLGINAHRRLLLLAQAFAIKGLRYSDFRGTAFNPNLHPSFDLYKAMPSAVFRATDHVRVQAGWSKDVYGRRVGAGSAWVLSLWYEF